MSLDIRLIEEACVELWNQYHDKIEEKGYSLSRDSFIQAPDGFTILASIGNKCPEEMLNYFRQIIPQEFTYHKGDQVQTYRVAVSPSISDIFRLL
nr:hypothetical protein [Nanoarchaeum sp.]